MAGGFCTSPGYPPLPIRLEHNNVSCMTLFNKGKATADISRFIEIRKFWISAYIQNGAVDMVYVPTAGMTSDYFTIPPK
jgi:hypothetical protein